MASKKNRKPKAKPPARSPTPLESLVKATNRLADAAAGFPVDQSVDALVLAYEEAKAVVEAAEKEPEKYRELQERMDAAGTVGGACRSGVLRRP